MGGSESKQPRPSYEDGNLRDPKIAEMQNVQPEEDARAHLDALIRKAAAPRRGQ